jgi:hypothetical protein
MYENENDASARHDGHVGRNGRRARRNGRGGTRPGGAGASGFGQQHKSASRATVEPGVGRGAEAGENRDKPPRRDKTNLPALRANLFFFFEKSSFFFWLRKVDRSPQIS